MLAEALLGPLEIGALLSSIMFGVTCLQCCLYFAQHSTNDPSALRWLVIVLMTLETLDILLIGNTLYIYSVKYFGKIEEFTILLWSPMAQRFVSSFLCAITQCLFAIRIYYLNGRHLSMPTLIVITSLMNISIMIGIAIKCYSMPTPFTYEQAVMLNHLSGLRTLIALSCDVMVTTCTIYHLLKRRTRLVGADRVIYRLIRYTLSTGLLTTIFALITCIVFFVQQQEAYTYAPYDFILTRLYVCSLISILNSRVTVQKEFVRAGHGTSNVLTSIASETDFT